MFMHYPFNMFAEWGEVQNHINVLVPTQPLAETGLAIILLEAWVTQSINTFLFISFYLISAPSGIGTK